MSATTFTPEPLFVHDSTTVLNEKQTGTFDILNRQDYSEDVKVIGDVKAYGGERFVTREEAKAYAKLFAASPDLLEALRLALPYVEGAYEAAFPDDDQNENVLDAVKAAIAKATL